MSRSFALVLFLCTVGCRGEGDVVVSVVSLERDAIDVLVSNNTDEDIVLLSPRAPTRRVDEKQCTVTISSVVEGNTYSFAFTPTLRTVRAGSATRFRANLAPLVLSGDCREWSVAARLAYVNGAEVRRFRGRTSVEFHRYVLTNQRIASVTSKLGMGSS